MRNRISQGKYNFKEKNAGIFLLFCAWDSNLFSISDRNLDWTELNISKKIRIKSINVSCFIFLINKNQPSFFGLSFYFASRNLRLVNIDSWRNSAIKLWRRLRLFKKYEPTFWKYSKIENKSLNKWWIITTLMIYNRANLIFINIHQRFVHLTIYVF